MFGKKRNEDGSTTRIIKHPLSGVPVGITDLPGTGQRKVFFVAGNGVPVEGVLEGGAGTNPDETFDTEFFEMIERASQEFFKGLEPAQKRALRDNPAGEARAAAYIAAGGKPLVMGGFRTDQARLRNDPEGLTDALAALVAGRMEAAGVGNAKDARKVAAALAEAIAKAGPGVGGGNVVLDPETGEASFVLDDADDEEPNVGDITDHTQRSFQKEIMAPIDRAAVDKLVEDVNEIIRCGWLLLTHWGSRKCGMMFCPLPHPRFERERLVDGLANFFGGILLKLALMCLRHDNFRLGGAVGMIIASLRPEMTKLMGMGRAAMALRDKARLGNGPVLAIFGEHAMGSPAGLTWGDVTGSRSELGKALVTCYEEMGEGVEARKKAKMEASASNPFRDRDEPLNPDDYAGTA